MNFDGKKLLVLAGAAVHAKVVVAAKNMGVYTIVTDYLSSSPAKLLADESWMLNITDIEGIVKRCRDEGVDGVLNFCIDPAQIPYQRITEQLGLPCYGTRDQFYTLTNKLAFKSFCSKCGVDVIPEYSLDDIENNLVDYPIFIKPSDSRGSRGQSICYSKEETDDAIKLAKKESSNGQIVIEKYMEGKQDFSITYFLCNGKPFLTRTCDRYLGRIEDNLSKQCIGAIAPSRYSDLFLDNIDSKVKRLIKSLGLTYGPFFMQGFIDGDKVRFYDPGLRFPGGETELLLKEATGVDLMKLMVEFALTGSFSEDTLQKDLFRFGGMHSVQMDITCKPGQIGRFVGIDEIKKCTSVKSLITRYQAGDTIPKSGDVRQRVLEIGVLINSGDSVRDTVDWIQSKLDVLDKNNNSMLISPLDVRNLDY